MTSAKFRWNEWNLEHATKHGVTVFEVEAIVKSARAPYPEHRADNRFRVVGKGVGGRLIQVVYLIDDDRTLYVIHARPITANEKHRHRRRKH